MKQKYDAIVIGAGPAGLACATELAAKGLDVALLDEQASPGGQIYRNITKATRHQQNILGEDYTAGLDLARQFQDSPVTYLPQTRVWQAEANGQVCYSRLGKSGKLMADFLVLSTGAMERPVPFPGWTLPGVMTCGGMSNLFKDSGLSPQKPVVLAGSGPLLWLVAEHLLALKAPLAAILDTTPMGQVLPAMKHMPKALRRFGYMMKGVKMIADVHLQARKAGVPIHRNVKNLRAEGENRLATVKASCGSRELVFSASTLMVSEGVIPNVALLRQIGCTHVWDEVQRFWYPKVDENGRSANLTNVFVAGDGNFVHGAKSAELKGRLAAFAIALAMHRISQEEYRELTESDLSGILTLGGTILGTSREKPFKGKKKDEFRKPLLIREHYEQMGLDCLVCIGGNGTMKTANMLSEEGLNVVGVPKTIDNDIWGTDMTFGFDSAVNIATEAIDRLHSTANSHKRIMVIEIMGHNAGWLALYSGMAGGGDVILIPEIPHDEKVVMNYLRKRADNNKPYSIVVVAEGIKIPEGEDSPARYLARRIEEETGLETRETVLGYIQRGGSPSPMDRVLASRFGAAGATLIAKEEYGRMVAHRDGQITSVKLSEVAGRTKLVKPDDPMVKQAREMGTSFGI